MLNPTGSPSLRVPFQVSPSSSAGARRPLPDAVTVRLSLQKGRFGTPDGQEERDGDDDVPVTREMLHRDLLEDPQVRRKRKKGGYRPLDNRDSLPFAVRNLTPDPYARPEARRAEQMPKDGGGGGRRRTTDLDRHLSPPPFSKRPPKAGAKTASRLYRSNDDGTDTSTLLGEFQLDKGTTSGDVIVLGDKEYRVESARCQYKYAGGQRFVMVRKILEVKEVMRVYKEEALMRQYRSSPPSRAADQPPQLE